MALFLFVFTYAVHTEFYTLSLHDALPIWVKVVKNKVAPPFKQAEFDIMYAEGISHTSLLVDIGAESGIIEKSGAWYRDRKSTRLNSSHANISYAVFCLKKKNDMTTISNAT